VLVHRKELAHRDAARRGLVDLQMPSGTGPASSFMLYTGDVA
jgi:hypothetical protein